VIAALAKDKRPTYCLPSKLKSWIWHPQTLALEIFCWVPSTVASGVVIALAAWLAIPASTPPILGADGKFLPGSNAELTTVPLGGLEKTILTKINWVSSNRAAHFLRVSSLDAIAPLRLDWQRTQDKS